MNGREEFARYIKAAREQTGLSKFSAGKGLGYQSDGIINAIEQGRTPLPVEHIHRIAALYAIDVVELLDKIRECEPRLYHKYETLQSDIIAYFAKRVVNQRSISRDSDQARHKEKLTAYILSEATRKLSQMDLELHERAGYDQNQQSFGFRHARHPRTPGFHPPRNLHRDQLRAAA